MTTQSEYSGYEHLDQELIPELINIDSEELRRHREEF